MLVINEILKTQCREKEDVEKKKVGMITLTCDFPGHPVVETYPSSSGGVGSIPGQGTRIPDALWPKSQITKQKRYCNKFSKDFLKISFFSH